MHRPNPRESPLLSRPRPPKVAPVPVAATSSPPSILSLARSRTWLGVCFLPSFSSPTRTLSNAFGSYTRCASNFFTTNHLHPLASTHEPPTLTAALIIPRFVPSSSASASGIHCRAWRHSTGRVSIAPLETPSKHECHHPSHARDGLPLYSHAAL